MMMFETAVDTEGTSSSAGAGSNKSDFSLLFGGHNSSSSSSYFEFKSSFQSATVSYEIGFRATKVSIDRAWFRPELFSQSSGFYRVGDTPTNVTLPSYPVAFLIAKDVTIKVKTSFSDTSAVSSYLQQSSSSNSNFLCFSASSSGSSEQHSESSYSHASSGGLIIRIPGPQILGWFLQDVDEHKSTKFNPSGGSVLPKELLDLLNGDETDNGNDQDD